MYPISDRKLATYPILPVYISPLSLYDRDVIVKNVYQICLLPNLIDSLVSYSEVRGITNLLRYLTILSLNSEEDVKIDFVCDNTWLIQNPQWGSNLHWISAANEEMSGNFISHLLDSGFESVLESLGMYLGLDSLEVLLVTSMVVLYSAKVCKH